MGESILSLAKTEYTSPNLQWFSINRKRANFKVRKLQSRIVKALKVGKHRKVKSLQWLLTHSFSGKITAVTRVTENKGRNTPGIDNIKWSTPEKKAKAILSLNTKGYKPKPLRRIFIPKANGKLRPLGIPTMSDRAMQALFKLALEPVSETHADLHSYGFRPERCQHDAISQCFNVLSRKRSAVWVLEADIKGCFDNISHQWLIDNIPINKTILKRWLKAGYIDNHKLFPTDAGTPQGGIISPVLSNMALDGIDKELSNIHDKHKIHLVRYADDFVVTASNREILENEVMAIIKAFLDKRGLTLSPEKTKISHISDGFDFLGVNIRKYDDKLFIKPSKQSQKNVMANIREIVNQNKAVKQDTLIIKLNHVIKGWCNYHRPFVSSKVFRYLDCQIFRKLWQWAKRRHTNKNKRWIKMKYFKSIGTMNWLFSDKETLKYAHNVTIVRHIKINSSANPFDKEWEQYLEKRATMKMKNNLLLTQRLRNIWLDQKGKCLICHDSLTSESGWDTHHIIHKVHGGTNNSSNLVLLHKNCHKQLHIKGLTVLKPLS
jgi:RNA-directed DNA polymerase